MPTGYYRLVLKSAVLIGDYQCLSIREILQKMNMYDLFCISARYASRAKNTICPKLSAKKFVQ